MSQQLVQCFSAMRRLSDNYRGSRGFLGDRAAHRGVGKNRSELDFGGGQTDRATGTVITGSDTSRSTNDESPRRSRTVASLPIHVIRVREIR